MPIISRQGEDLMENINKHTGVILFEGILFVLFGVLAVLLPFVATLTITLIVGWLLLISGIFQGILSFQKMGSRGFFWSLLSALLSFVIGILLVVRPFQGMVTLTILLAAFFVIEGVFEILMALEYRPAGRWGWLLFSGITALILAVIIFSGLPGTAAWAIGLLLGINMIFFGFALTSISAALRKLQS